MLTRKLIVCAALVAACGLAGCGESAARRAAKEAAKAKASADEAARAEAVAEREAERLKALWTYSDTPAGKGRQLSAQIKSTNDVDTDGKGARWVLLVFRDHPAWGRSSYLVLNAGDFRCTPRCTVAVTIDKDEPLTLPAHRPNTNEAIAMFIDDWRTLWRRLAGASQVTIEFPVKVGGTRAATFDVGGLDRTKMPGWERLSAPGVGDALRGQRGARYLGVSTAVHMPDVMSRSLNAENVPPVLRSTS